MSEHKNQKIIITVERCKNCGGSDLVVVKTYRVQEPYKEYREFDPTSRRFEFIGHIVKRQMIHCRDCKEAGRPHIIYRNHVDPTAAHEQKLSEAKAAAEKAAAVANDANEISDAATIDAEEATANADDLAAKADDLLTPPWEKEPEQSGSADTKPPEEQSGSTETPTESVQEEKEKTTPPKSTKKKAKKKADPKEKGSDLFAGRKG